MIGVYILILGLMLILTPIILMALDGVETKEDMIRWHMQKPYQFIKMIRPMIISGVGLVVAGLAIAYMP